MGRGDDMTKRLEHLLLSALLVFGVLIVSPTPVLARELKIGDLPPSTLSDVHLSEYRGKIVIISFWASWCPPCRRELPVLAAIQKAATQERVAVLLVNWKDTEQGFRDVKKYLRKQGIDIKLLFDPSNYIGRNYDVNAIPHMIIIGRDGRIAAIHVGYSASEIPIFEKEINGLLAQSAALDEGQAQRFSPARTQ